MSAKCGWRNGDWGGEDTVSHGGPPAGFQDPVGRGRSVGPPRPNSATAGTRRPGPPLPIRGRSAHLAVIDSAIDRLNADSGSLIVVEGPPGIGKTRLLAEARIRATRAGARVLSGAAHEDQQIVPFAPLYDALLHADPPVCDSGVLRKLSTAADIRYWVVHDLQGSIQDAASETPLVVSIDDVHWADPGTMATLRTLIDGLANAAVVWILTMRSAGGRPEVRAAVTALLAARAGAAHHLRLGPLDREAGTLIARDVLGAHADESLSRLVDTAHGNPFLIFELLHGLTEENRVEVEGGRAKALGAGLPARLATTMQHRLELLSGPARHVVQVASVLPARFSATLLAHTLGQSPSRIVAIVEEVIQADLLVGEDDQLSFRHDLVRRAARQTLPSALRRAMERESATALLELGAAPEEVAATLARSAEIGDQAAVSALREAAHLLARTDPAGAAELSHRAFELLRHDDPARSTVITATVALLNQASRHDQAQRLASETLTSDLPAEEEALIRLSLSAASSDWPAQRADENRHALQISGVSPQTKARHLGWLAYNAMLDGQGDTAREAGRSALDAADAANDLQTRLIAELAVANVDCSEGYWTRCFDNTAKLEPYFWTLEAGVVGGAAAVSRANILVSTGRLTAAVQACAEGLQNARRQGNGPSAQIFTLVQALAAYAAGQLSVSRQIVESLLSEDERLDARQVGGRVALPLLAAIAARTDDRVLQRQTGIALRAALAGGPAVGREATTALAHIAWQRGDTAEAARWLGEDVDLLTSPMYCPDIDNVVVATRVACASSDAGLRQRALTAVALLDREHNEQSLFTAVAMHARGLLERDLSALDDAVQRLSELQRPLLHAGAVEDVGLALAHTDRDRAVERLNLAFDIYGAHESTSDARRTARSLQRLGVRRRVVRPRSRSGWDSLTATELRVMELVADGATNPEVARRLNVSRHTVNTHLRNVFGKLGIHSRSELTRLMRGIPDT